MPPAHTSAARVNPAKSEDVAIPRNVVPLRSIVMTLEMSAPCIFAAWAIVPANSVFIPLKLVVVCIDNIDFVKYPVFDSPEKDIITDLFLPCR